MATTATLTGTFTLPNDAAPNSAVLSVIMSAMDTDQNTRDILMDDGSFTVALVAGAIPAGQEIWKNTAGLRGTHYRATLAWTAPDGRLLSRYLGSFQVGDDASYDMADLLDQPPIATLPEGWYSTLTQSDYDAAITARDEAVAARDQIFADGGVVSLDGVQTLTNKTAVNLALSGPPTVNGVPLMITPEMFNSASDGVADDTDAFEAAWQAAIDEGVPFVVRRPHLLTRQMALVVNGAVLFDWQGGRIQAAGDYGEGDNLLYLTPGSASGVAFEGVGGDIDISGMPPGMFTTNDAFNLSPGFDLTRIRWHGYRMYSGPAWKQSGADSHIFAVADDIDLDGIHIGAYDAAIYASSGSNGSGARKSGLRVRGRFIGCQYGVTAKRTFRDLDIIANAVNCLGAVGSGTAQVDGSTVLGSENGVIIVNARNCEWPLIHRWGDKVTCIVNSVDGGAYYAESSPGAGDGYASVEYSAARLVGSKRNYVTINAHGINPLCTSLSTTNRSNARAVEFEAGNGESTHNRVEIHCSGLGRVSFEQDASDYNIITYTASDMSEAAINSLVGANSRAYSVGHDNARSGTEAAPGMAFSSDPDTGFYRPAANQIGMATGGVERVLLSTTALGINLPVTGDAVMSGSTDLTAGRLMVNGAHGLGILRNVTSATDLDTIDPGFWGNNSALSVPVNVPVAGAYRWTGWTHRINSGTASQMACRIDANAIYHRQQDSGVWSDWSRLYSWNNIIGTVSLSGGVPTGRLIEPGSNANGRYVRLPDGTQICWQTVTVNTAISTAFLGGFRSTGQTWTFPAAFSAAPSLSGSSPDQTTLAPVFGTTGATSTNWNAVAFTSQSAADRTVTIMAIGRWV